MIKKLIDVNTNINISSVENGFIGANFYTEDDGSAYIRITIKNNNEVLDFTKTDMLPRLDLFCSDGSIFTNEPIDIVYPEKGVIQYKVSDNVIQHAGKMDAKLFLGNKDDSVHVANFYFTISDSGMTGPIGKEVHVDSLKGLVEQVMRQNALGLLDDKFLSKVQEDLKTYVHDNNDLFKGVAGEKGDKGDKGDTGDTGPQGLQGIQGLPGKDGKNGIDGLDGKNGVDGIDGVDGVKGDKGDPFTYNDFTPSQLEALKGPKGEKGDVGPVGPIASIEKLYLYNKLNGMFSNYEVPSELKINVPFTIQTNKNGETKFSYDVSTKKNSVTKTYYVDIKTGNNANIGTQEEPFKSINRALRYGDADEIVVNEGVYGWSDGFSGFSQAKPFNLIGKGTVIIGAHRDNLTWTKNSTYSNVYQTTATSVNEVVDFKNTNDIRILTKQPSLQAVSENIGSFYIDTSNNIYVRTHDDRTPDEKILPNMIADGVKLTDNPKIYFENVTFSNTVRLTASTTNKQFYAKNCQFSVGTGNNALSIEGYDYNILQNCTASYGTMDGFNYHVGNGILPKVIEIDCKGYNNGRNGADQNNGSTMHDGGHILRIGGEYYGNSGPNVIDVNEGTMSVNLGVYSHNSNATKGTVSNTCFKNGNIGASKMYLINCLSNGSDYSVVTATSQDSSTVIDNSLLMENQTTV